MFGSLTFNSTVNLAVSLPFLSALSPALPLLGIILGIGTFISLSALMLNDVADLLKTPGAKENIKNFFLNLININPQHPQNLDDDGQTKSRGRIIAERISIIVLTLPALFLAGLGIFFTAKACAPAMKALILEKIPNACVIAVDIATKVIAQGLAVAGQLPFNIISAVRIVFETVKAFGDGIAL